MKRRTLVDENGLSARPTPGEPVRLSQKKSTGRTDAGRSRQPWALKGRRYSACVVLPTDQGAVVTVVRILRGRRAATPPLKTTRLQFSFVVSASVAQGKHRTPLEVVSA